MRLTRRSIERASEVQQATAVGWYAAIGGAICLLGCIWAVSLFVGSGASEDRGKAYETAVKRASRDAAEQRVQLRLAAAEEARNMAADAARPIHEPLPQPFPVEAASPAATAVPSAAPAVIQAAPGE